MTIKVLGPGCMNCRTLELRTREVLAQAGSTATVEKVTELDRIVAYGVMRTPALVIDEKLVWQGSVPTIAKIRELIAANTPVTP